MAVRSIAQLKTWFKRGLYPVASQFADWMDSYWHKQEKIPISAIENLSTQLNDKYAKTDGEELKKKHDILTFDVEKHKRKSQEKFETVYKDIDTTAEATLRSANEHTNAREVVIRNDFAVAETATLRDAKSYADQVVAALVDSSPEALNTLQELAAALGEDPNFAATVMAEIGKREIAFDKNTAFNKNFGNQADTICQGNDARLADARNTINQAGGVLKIWTGTQAQYDALNKANDTLYFVL